MAKKRSEKEFILNLYLKKYPEVLERILGVDVCQVELEVPYGRKKIDFYGVSKTKRIEIFVENQLTSSDEAHLKEKIWPILHSLQEGIVVWTALRFDEKHLATIRAFLKANPQKYINFYSLEINPEVIQELERLDNINRLDIWSNLSWINKVGQPLNMVFQHEQMPNMHVGRAYVGDYQYDFERMEDVKKYLLEYLRKHLEYLPNIHKSKKHTAHNSTISLGAGISGAIFQLSTRNKQGKAFVGIHFDQNREGLYRKFSRHKSVLMKDVHPNIVFGKRSIRVHFEPGNNVSDTMKQIKTILEKMVQFFTPYLVGTKKVVFDYGVTKTKDKQGSRIVEEVMNMDRELLNLVDPLIAEIMLEEVVDEQAFFAQEEKISEYLAYKY